MTYHVCVWIDHREARVYLLAGHDDPEIMKIFSDSPVYHIHRKSRSCRSGYPACRSGLPRRRGEGFGAGKRDPHLRSWQGAR